MHMHVGYGLLQVLPPVQRFHRSQDLPLVKSLLPRALPCCAPFALIILLVSEDPLCSNHSCIFGSLFKCPHLVAREVVQLLLHGNDPILITKSFLCSSSRDTKAWCSINKACLERVVTPRDGPPMMRSWERSWSRYDDLLGATWGVGWGASTCCWGKSRFDA